MAAAPTFKIKDNFTYAPSTPSSYSAGQVTQIAGGSAQGLGALFSAYAQYRAGKDSLKRARENASILRVQAQEELVAGEQGSQEIGRMVNGVIGDQKAAYAGQGVRVDTGSAAILAEQSLAAAGADIEKIRTAARKKAEDNIRRARMMEDEGESAYKGARLNAAGTAISGLGSAAASIAGGMA